MWVFGKLGGASERVRRLVLLLNSVVEALTRWRIEIVETLVFGGRCGHARLGPGIGYEVMGTMGT